MEVKVKRDDVLYTCKSQEQLDLFLEAGYEVVKEEKVAPKPRKKTEKVSE